MNPDQINALFEIGGGLFILNHCRVLWKDQAVAGVSAISTIFFVGWGAWNCYFYAHLDQFYSLLAQYFMLSSNVLYVMMQVWFKFWRTPCASLPQS